MDKPPAEQQTTSRARIGASWLLLRLFSLLPLPATHALGFFLGLLLYLIPNRRRTTARINLAHCLPELNAAQRSALLRQSLIELGKLTAETVTLWMQDERGIRRLVRRVEGQEHIGELLARGRGLILALPHIGSWEIVNLYCSLHWPVTTLYRRPPMAEMAGLMRSGRERFGAQLMPTDTQGVRALRRALSRGEMVAILPDQVPGGGGGAVFAPFFGIPASTMVLLPRLAAASGAPVVFACAERLPWGRGFVLRFTPAPETIQSENVEISATAMNAMVERCARAAPAQYQWVYKRFRVAPPGIKPIY